MTTTMMRLKRMKRAGYGEVNKVNIEGDEHLSSDITWTKKISKTDNQQKAWIQASVEACISKSTHPSNIKLWLIDSMSNAD